MLKRSGQDSRTQRNTTLMAWNRKHLARMLKDAGGLPAHGNQPAAGAAGCRFDHPGPHGDARPG